MSIRVLMTSIFSIFFFKQKTAYEMRISDWSSDVCSSDLADHARQGVLLSRPLGRSGGGVEAAGDPDCRSDARFGRHPRQLLGLRPPRADPVLAQEIGRASCRARVCQYV